MKIASIANAVRNHNDSLEKLAESAGGIEHIIVHTGQHYDQKMSQSFFDQLGIPEPDINLGIGSGSHASQTAEIMKAFEKILLRELPDILLVVGDVNSTIACSLVAAKIEYPKGQRIKRPVIVHVEAGLRSFDRTMPEEVNRILTDSLSDMLFVTEQSGVVNLTREGISAKKIFFTGNVMIDTLQHHLQQAENSTIKKALGIDFPYGLVTLHRPSNVDTAKSLEPLIDTLLTIALKIKLIFAVHPRTMNSLKQFDLLTKLENCHDITLSEPLSYLDFLHLTKNADLVITDSGGIQEETTFLNIPCVTLRENTERPVTVDIGSNYLVGTNPEKIIESVNLILSGQGKPASTPELWDGRAGERIVRILTNR